MNKKLVVAEVLAKDRKSFGGIGVRINTQQEITHVQYFFF